MTAYLDNAATTRIHPEVQEAMDRVRVFGNPSSLHKPGREARRTLDDAREMTADILGVDPREILFTSGATEANNLAIFGAARAGKKKGNHIVTTVVEHPAVLEPCGFLKEGFEVTYLPVDEHGRVDPEAVNQAVRPGTVLVSVMLANNEVGTVQPVGEIQSDAPLHTDAAQACGKMKIRPAELGADLVTLSGHKMHGPRGTGVLYVRKGTPLEPLTLGGGQEFDRRAGTENVVAAVGFAEALKIAERDLDRNVAHMEAMREKLRNGLASIRNTQWNGHATERIPSLLNVSFHFVDGEAVILSLDAEGVFVSSGSACASTSLEPSHVLRAMGRKDETARGSVRFSVAADTKEEEIDHALAVVPKVIERLRKISAVG